MAIIYATDNFHIHKTGQEQIAVVSVNTMRETQWLYDDEASSFEKKCKLAVEKKTLVEANCRLDWLCESVFPIEDIA